jgi:hypothetical protein
MTSNPNNVLLMEDPFLREIKLHSIFWPHGMEKRQKFYKNPLTGKNPSARFVHYTSAEAALNIIRSKRIWMRNATCMTDYSEVQHGFSILREFFVNQENLKAFTGVLDAFFEGAALEAIKLFDQWWRDIQFNTYITSISEHDDSEDVRGRLSMWRAFGGNVARVALVLKIPWKMESDNLPNLFFSPVAYLSKDDVHKEIDMVIKNIRENAEFLKLLSRAQIIDAVFSMLLTSVLCLKHEGFHEEREWRVIHAPRRTPSSIMESSTEVIKGVPQIVYKIPLDSNLLQDISLPKLFDRVIIGPSPYPWAMYEAFTHALTEAGIVDAGAHVFTSNIPIRA